VGADAEPAQGALFDAPVGTASPVKVPYVLSLVSMGLFFLPLGVFAVLAAVLAGRARNRGESDKARRWARTAKVIAIATIVVGILVDVAIITALLLLGAG
jgi:cytochrome c biogenesis protein CcdA